MSVHKSTRPWIAEDGSTWASEELARVRSNLVLAHRRYKRARDVLQHRLSKAYVTHDGQPFQVGTLRDYWVLVKNWAARPVLRKLTCYRTEEIDVRDGEVYFQVRESDGRTRTATYEINELYATEEAAEDALDVALEEHIAHLQEDLAKIRQKKRGRP